MVESYKLPLFFEIYNTKYNKNLLTLSEGDRLLLKTSSDYIEIYNLQDELCGYVPCKYTHIVRQHIEKYELRIFNIDVENKNILLIFDTTYSFSK